MHGDVREPRGALGDRRSRRADRVLGRALGAGRRRRRDGLPRPHQPDRRLQLPRAGPPRRRLQLVFLSTSRVYPVRATVGARLDEAADPLRARRRAGGPRAPSPAGISEDFPLDGARTLYGATKLAAELLIEEYAAGFGLRDGDRPLRRDRRALADGQGRPGRLHPLAACPPLRPPAELHRLRRRGQAGARPAARRRPGRPGRATSSRDPGGWDGRTRATSAAAAESSLSLLETTEICRELTGNEVPIEPVPETRPGDVPIYLSDCAPALRAHGVAPAPQTPRRSLADIHEWIAANESQPAPRRSDSTAAARVN